MPTHPAQFVVWAATWTLCVLVFILIFWRPRDIPEYVWAVAGAVLLVVFRLLPWGAAWTAVRAGTSVYCFLAGMMLLAELARQHGVFDWLAALAMEHAQGSQARLFMLVYGIGIVVTSLLSNDATAVLLTPAVLAVVRRAKTSPLPISSPARSSPMQPALFCPSPTRRIWLSSTVICLRWPNGCVYFCSPPLAPSESHLSCCGGTVAESSVHPFRAAWSRLRCMPWGGVPPWESCWPRPPCWQSLPWEDLSGLQR